MQKSSEPNNCLIPLLYSHSLNHHSVHPPTNHSINPSVTPLRHPITYPPPSPQHQAARQTAYLRDSIHLKFYSFVCFCDLEIIKKNVIYACAHEQRQKHIHMHTGVYKCAYCKHQRRCNGECTKSVRLYNYSFLLFFLFLFFSLSFILFHAHLNINMNAIQY